ncbi:MAG TPA: amidohydrolase [Bacteroidales bacterium]|nr:MAG: N-acyl-L-amino acid amidohydrolase [Bacteroidetes bacterium GWE2_42_24]OFY28438.1 MAG: N-acyl-L-amino acid amidohydrolase [Bacteroidetes bacterium GWF2_43_11]HBZ65659.1 amidohydrolase [Bacteroidales bacterium]
MKNLKDQIQKLALDGHAEFVGWRRYLHQYPELSTEEHQTAAFVAKRLTESGIPFTPGVAGTGIVAHITGRKTSNRLIALRADMDALPITEENDVPYKSLNPGVMHACGHDVHTSSLLGAARILQTLRDDFGGTIRLIFQPSEEKYPGGAIMMIGEGVLRNPTPEAIFGQHVLPELDAGMIGLRPGKYMASTDEIYLTVKGKGGHGATPDKNIDPVLIASHIVVALQQIVSRHAAPTMPTVISFGKVVANGRTNIIPAEVRLEGTIRTFSETWRAEAHQLIRRIAQGTARAMGGDCDVFIDPGYPFLVNNPELTARTRQWAIDFLGAGKVADLDLRMTAEDFAYYSQQIPGCFYRLGIRNEARGITHSLHSSLFDADESSLITGPGLMAWVAINSLQ